MSSSVRYLVFDIESVADAPLVAKLRYPGESLAPADAVRRYRDELMAEVRKRLHPLHVSGSDFGRGGQSGGRLSPGRRCRAGRAAVPPARHHRELLAGLGTIPAADAW